LSSALRDDLDAVRFVPLGQQQSMTWEQSLRANYSDGVLVMHRGRVVQERYFGALTRRQLHIAMSVTKSFVGTLGTMLLQEGLLDETALIAHYIPELRDTGFGNASLRQVMDMTTALRHSEDYTDPHADVFAHASAGGILPRPAGYRGPQSFCEYLLTVQQQGEHGAAFAYRTINTDVLAWVIRRVSGESLAAQLQNRLWTPLGAEQDAIITVDSTGTEFAGGGLNTCLRDLARMGEMMRQRGSFNGRQIVPEAVVAEIERGGDPLRFASAGMSTLPGWSYANMWWISHNEHGAYMARGVHGQAIYIDPVAEMVIVRYASHPLAGNVLIDPHSLPAYHALAGHLLAN
jgi:CubicO group peptidase (beta-lactamase class C family)